MVNVIKMNAILIAEGALLPESALFESTPYVYEWRLVKNIGSRSK
jgi:hypothetical protein